MDLMFQYGQFIILFGLLGCGKIILLWMFVGLEQLDVGEIVVGDQCIFLVVKWIDVFIYKCNLGMVFQDFVLWLYMMVYENVVFGLRVGKQKVNLWQKVIEVFGMVCL